MKASRIVFSDLAVADILAQTDWYELRSDRKLAQRWERAVTSTALRLAATPQSGTPCTFQSRELEGTRKLAVNGFSSHLVFYRIVKQRIHVLRVLHGSRDLQNLFSE